MPAKVKSTSTLTNSINLKEIVDSLDRQPPHNIDVERALLGALLIDRNALLKVTELIKPDHFYDGKHIKLYEAILELYKEGMGIDIVTLSDLLEAKHLLDKVGGAGYIADLINASPTAVNAEAYAKIVQENFLRRELISINNDILNKSFEKSVQLSEVLSYTEEKIFAVLQNSYHRNLTALQQVLADNFDRLEEMHRNKGKLRGVATGFRDIDNKLAGLQESNLIILAARPSVGKTSLALNISQFVAVHDKVPTLFFSLESSKEELADRLLSSQSNIDSWKITTGNLSDKDWALLTDAMGELAEAPFYIDDTPGMSIEEMRIKAKKAQLEHGIKLVIVDYLQLAKSERMRGSDNRVQEVSEVSQGLKAIAKELKCPVIALSQLSRNVEQRGTADKPAPPQLSDLRDSGSIEQDADVVMFLWREDNTLATRGSADTIPVKLSIAKHRNGPVGEIDLIFKGARTRYYGVEKKQQS